jgi:hypothetical protein
VKKLRTSFDDDDNDTLLFQRLEQNALSHPNPERKGCPGHAILKAFVAKPSGVELSDMNDLHVFECAECARELIELRCLREEKLRQAASISVLPKQRRRRFRTIAASLCVVILIVAAISRIRGGKFLQPVPDDAAVSVTLDLNIEGPGRGAGLSATRRLISFPRKLINLHLILPYHSPVGDYRITVGKDKSLTPLMKESARAVGQGIYTELRVSLDLRQLSPGGYDLGTAWDGESEMDFYPFMLD